jgi:hypothetical protein
MSREYLVKSKAVVEFNFKVSTDDNLTPEETFSQIREHCILEAEILQEQLQKYIQDVREYGVESITEEVYKGTGESNDPSVYIVRNDLMNIGEQM